MKKSIYIYISNVCYLLPLGSLSFSHSFHSRFEIENLLQILGLFMEETVLLHS